MVMVMCGCVTCAPSSPAMHVDRGADPVARYLQNATWWDSVLAHHHEDHRSVEFRIRLANAVLHTVEETCAQLLQRDVDEQTMPDAPVSLYVNTDVAADVGERRASDKAVASYAPDCAALWDLYEATDGPSWASGDGWANGKEFILESCCDPTVYRVYCNAYGRVTELQLVSNLLRGSVPASLSTLTQLEVLDLAYNDLSGPFPEWIGNLTRLSYINLGSNGFHGRLPDGVFERLPLLNALQLFENGFDGPIPESIGVLSNLQTLDLSANRLNGPVPQSFNGSLANLQTLMLGANQLSGSLPESLGALPQLQTLQLQNNFLNGTIPELSLSMSLLSLNLQANKLAGPLPGRLCALQALRFLYLSANAFTTFPNCSVASLVNIDLSSNQLTSFPFLMIANFSNLLSLDLSHNALMGPFPLPLFSGRVSLRSLSLAYNQFNGSFPIYPCGIPIRGKPNVTEVDFSGGLINLDLSGNIITGIPGILDYQTCTSCPSSALYYSLSSLSLSRTSLPSKFPPSLLPSAKGPCPAPAYPATFLLKFLPGLRNVDLSNNDLNSDLDSVLDSLPLLSTVDFRGNPNARFETSLTESNQRLFVFNASSAYIFSQSLSCFVAEARGVTVQTDPEFYNYRYCVCRPGFFGKPPNCSRCLSSNAECSFPDEDVILRLDATTAWNDSGNVVPLEGYYASPPVSLSEMESNTAYPHAIELCLLAGTDLTPCKPSPETGSNCAEGYTGRLCASCSQRYFRTGDRCVSCPENGTLIVFGIFICACIVGWIVWSFFVGSSSSGIVKVLTFFLQSLFFVRTPMPSNLYVFTHSGASIASFSFAGPECFFRGWGFKESYTVAVVCPVAACLLVLAIWGTGTAFRVGKRQSERRRSLEQRWLDRCLRACIFLLMFLFMPAIRAILSPLSCAQDAGDGRYYIRYFPDVECSTALQTVSAILLVLYIAAIPGLLSFAVIRSRALAGKDLRSMYIFSLLFSSYRPGCRWWELVVTFRRILFIGAFVTLPRLSVFMPLMVCLVLTASGVFQATASPFESRFENIAEITSLALLIVNIACSMQSQILGASNVDSAGAVLFVLNASFVATLFAFLAWAFLHRASSKFRTFLRSNLFAAHASTVHNPLLDRSASNDSTL
eukprot:ANDGO_01672.mRNA.1 Putative leucine-rich repeat-containing protein DDB_G0281931